MESILYPKKVAIGAGIVGGIVGGSVMYGIMSTLMTQIGMGANCFAIIMGLITGQSYENALGPGITAHFLTSIAIGVAFGAIINVKRLQVRGFGKGIGLGVATGVIAFAVIFVPIAMTVLPAHMMDLMKMMPMGNNAMPGNNMKGASMDEKSSMSESANMQGKPAMDEKMKMEEMDKMMMEQNEKLFPMILAGAFVSHIAFGAALGLVVTPIVKRSTEKSGR
ncbi:MAG TPA: hypothetical protein VFU58_06300 [Candidatus Nitrosotalea sp.]|nr:hypothetical protein [Candidatus Nitrosotalea sp.]